MSNKACGSLLVVHTERRDISARWPGRSYNPVQYFVRALPRVVAGILLSRMVNGGC